ncbi:hypothetical protein Rhopal_000653-T1 [Rhodotorula paludigena]|uniref:DUF967 domain protein n=1 Tax=Rhodotorula paludigena TaxID=86838 RepID=A0AAV5GGI2_9BASI|nr:hypothetical protein Rhopal_000653-T1 [Rhodotorula paludigena]
MSYDAAAVAKHEELRLVTFSSEVAFTLGVRLREHLRSKFPGEPAIIDIRAAASEQQYFFATCAEGSVLDQMRWAQRKRNVVLRWGKSTASMNIKTNGGNIPAHYGLNTDDYACHGGGFPIRVQGVEPLVGVICVSGLKQEDDHQVIVDVLSELIEEQEKEKAAKTAK